MAKKKPKGNLRLKVIAGVLAVLVVASLGLARFLATERGNVFLLDVGLDGRFGVVREDLGKRIIGGFLRADLGRERIKSKVEKSPEDGRKVVVFYVQVSQEASLVGINSAVAEAVSAGGGRVRSCREISGGRGIEMVVGTRRVTTHRCVIRKVREKKDEAVRFGEGPSVALIVDDFGFFNNSLVRDFLSLDIPLTISVIPGLRHSGGICRQALEAGKEVLCHLPMEPEQGADDVGEIPLVRVSMKDREIERIVEEALETTPGVVGMNNHQGSKATADRRVMRAVLGVCRSRDIFFVDSMTTPRSVAREVAEQVGVKSLGNDMFIDNAEEDTRDNMRKLMSIAERRGRTLGIMHVRRSTLAELRWFIDEAREKGITFLKVSEMIESEEAANKEGG